MTRSFSVPPTGARRDVVLLGSTGSIGTQALAVIARNPDRFRVVGLAAGGAHPELLAQQAVAYEVAQVAVADPARAGEVQMELAARIPPGRRPEVLIGPAAAAQLAGSRCDVVLNGMTGAVGLAPTLAALNAGSLLALANKESLIIGGAAGEASRRTPDRSCRWTPSTRLWHRLCGAGGREEVRRLVLTASGGPFRGRSRDELREVTAGAGAGAPDLGDGTGRHDQLGHAGEQGPRGHRGAPALRRADGPDRRHGAPAVGDPLAGGVRRRHHAGACQPAGHAPADRAGAWPGRSG